MENILDELIARYRHSFHEADLAEALELAWSADDGECMNLALELALSRDWESFELETLELLFEAARTIHHPRRLEIGAHLGVQERPIVQSRALDPKALRRMLLLFRGREDVHARQFSQGSRTGYRPIRQAISEKTLTAHLSGELSLGVYLLNENHHVQFAALDFDIRRAILDSTPMDVADLLRQLRSEILSMQEALKLGGQQPVLEFSGGKGFHVWYFFAEPVPAQLVRRVMQENILPKLKLSENLFQHELFPKQDKLNRGGLGNLIKLPLGRHLGSGHWSRLLDWRGQPVHDVSHCLLNEIQPLRRDWLLESVGSPNDVGQTFFEVREDSNQEILHEPAADLPVVAPKSRLKEVRDDRFLAIRSGCDTLRTLMKRVETLKMIDKSERHVLVYLLAPLGEAGQIVIHHLLSQTLHYDPNEVDRWIRAVPPHLISCPKIRKRIPGIATHSACNCQFQLPEGCYPSPHVHAGIIPKAKGGILEQDKARMELPPGDDWERICEGWISTVEAVENLKEKLLDLESLILRRLPTDDKSTVQVQGQRHTYAVTRLEDSLKIERVYESSEVLEDA